MPVRFEQKSFRIQHTGDSKKFGDEWDRIFKKKTETPCETCNGTGGCGGDCSPCQGTGATKSEG